MSQRFRIAQTREGATQLTFTFNGRRYDAWHGDTLASGLLANGVHLIGRSFKYHRPRGILSCGSEEPNGIVDVGAGAYREPNLRATQVELYHGLQARSVNCSGNPAFDWRAAHQAIGGLLVAGFYNKTFMWPRSFWRKVYEPRIRAAAGLGIAPEKPDPDRYDKMHWHCDVLIVGAGPAGLAAARESSDAGLNVVICDESAALGGTALHCGGYVEGKESVEWATAMVETLRANRHVLLLPRTTVVGYYDNNYLVAVEQRTDHQAPGSMPGVARQRLWHLHAKQVILATGAHDRPLVFASNDLPGTMLAAAVSAYAGRYGVSCGERGVAIVNNDWAYDDVLHAHRLARNVVAIADYRTQVHPSLSERVRSAGIELLRGYVPVRARGWHRVSSLELHDRSTRAKLVLDCDHILMSGGRNPIVHLFSQAMGRVRFDDALSCFVPGATVANCITAGAVNGNFDVEACIAEGTWAGRAARDAVRGSTVGDTRPSPLSEERRIEPLWSASVALRRRMRGKHFVDFQNDVTERDIRLATQEGFRSVEHVKRYTTNGMATDQGKTSNVNALGITAQCLDSPISQVGTTTFRPPYAPVSFGALAGRDRGPLTDPVRTTPMHEWHVEHGAVFEDVGQWKRPYYYPRDAETMRDAVLRECAAVRSSVGVMDATTLGKIEIWGPGAAEFLNRIYTNAWLKLPVGSCRYGVMCKPDGMVLDDGVTSRLGEQRYFMTTTTSNAARVLDWLEEWLQTEWPQLKVYCASVTEQWCTVAVAGPRSRDVLRALAPEVDFTNAAFPFMTFRNGLVAGVAARVSRISFSGELAYEINVPSCYGLHMWKAVIAAGAPWQITPYGTETMHVLRAEKGYIIIGQETDGTVTPLDLGLGWALKKSGDYIGARSLTRGDIQRSGRKQLVGFLPLDPAFVVAEGSHFVAGGTPAGSTGSSRSLGHVTSSYMSATLGRSFGLALIKDGLQRIGETVYCIAGEKTQAIRLTDAVLYDKEGKRRDGDR